VLDHGASLTEKPRGAVSPRAAFSTYRKDPSDAGILRLDRYNFINRQATAFREIMCRVVNATESNIPIRWPVGWRAGWPADRVQDLVVRNVRILRARPDEVSSVSVIKRAAKISKDDASIPLTASAASRRKPDALLSCFRVVIFVT